MRIISGKYGRRRFDVPHNITARPTTDMAREGLFNLLTGMVDLEGLRCADLFAGTGAISLELVSRGAASVTAVEKATVQARFIGSVVQQLQEPAVHVVKGDVFRFIATCHEPFDLVFADPPYDLPQLATLPQTILSSGMVRPGTLVIVEHPRDYNFEQVPGWTRHRNYGKVNFSFFEAIGEIGEVEKMGAVGEIGEMVQ